MADQYKHEEINKSDEPSAPKAGDRGLFDFVGKKEEGEAVAGEFDQKVKVSEEDSKKHQTLGEKLQRSNSSSSSSSGEEEIGEDGEKKKKKKDKNKCDENKAAQEGEEKKGLLDKIKEKLPGGKKVEEVATPPPTPAATAECATSPAAEDKEKKGFLDKIKDKIPGYSKTDDEKEEKEKEKEKEAVCN